MSTITKYGEPYKVRYYAGFDLRTMMSPEDFSVMDSMTSGMNSRAALRGNAMAIREFGHIAVELILRKREDRRRYEAAQQRHWATHCSRRAQRNNHHDSWAIRESYVRYSDSCGSTYLGFNALGHDMIRAAIQQGAKIKSWNLARQSRYYTIQTEEQKS